jgi:hypothetical protein
MAFRKQGRPVRRADRRLGRRADARDDRVVPVLAAGPGSGSRGRQAVRRAATEQSEPLPLEHMDWSQAVRATPICAPVTLSTASNSARHSPKPGWSASSDWAHQTSHRSRGARVDRDGSLCRPLTLAQRRLIDPASVPDRLFARRSCPSTADCWPARPTGEPKSGMSPQRESPQFDDGHAPLPSSGQATVQPTCCAYEHEGARQDRIADLLLSDPAAAVAAHWPPSQYFSHDGCRSRADGESQPAPRQKQGAGPASIDGNREDTASRSRARLRPDPSARVAVRRAPAPDDERAPRARDAALSLRLAEASVSRSPADSL